MEEHKHCKGCGKAILTNMGFYKKILLGNSDYCETCLIDAGICAKGKKEIQPPKKLHCFLDGDALCVVGDDFKNLQESNAFFIDLSKGELEQIKKRFEE